MKVLLLGGITDDDIDIELQRSLLRSAITLFVESMIRNDHEVAICSPYPDSADRFFLDIIESMDDKSVLKNISLYYPAYDEIENEFNKFKFAEAVRMFPVARIDNSIPGEMEWLFAQLTALDNVGFVVAVGGKRKKSASLLLQMAMHKGKTIIPFGFIGGASMDYQNSNSLYYNAFMNGQRRKLNIAENMGKCFDYFLGTQAETIKKFEKRFFISYPTKRPGEADYVENILRRNGMSVFRDEESLKPSANLPAELLRNIQLSDFFIVIWCMEYACSPWCMDEFEYALDLKEIHKLELWIICVDDTRIIPKRARNLLNISGKNRRTLQSAVLKNLQQAK